jgi:serine phosphatase RsbU (regulator of sigma subunit)
MCELQERPDPRQLLSGANARLNQDLAAGSFVTTFVGFLGADGKLDWCSGGHGPILIRRTRDATIEEFDANAPPLGILPDFDPEPIEPIRLDLGGLICIPSDGIAEAMSPANEQFGVARLTELIAGRSDGGLQDLITRLREQIVAWQGTEEPHDDQTLVIARRR